MKKAYGLAREIIGKAGTYFTLIVFLFSSIVSITLKSGANFRIETGFLAYALVFSLFLAADDLILKIEKIQSFAIKVVMHYTLAVTDFVVFMCLLPGVSSSGRQTIILTIVFTLAYVIIMTVYCVLRAIVAKKAENEKDYAPKFSGKEE